MIFLFPRSHPARPTDLTGRLIRRQRRGAWLGLLAMTWHFALLLGQTIPAAAFGFDRDSAPPFLVNCVVYGSKSTPQKQKDHGQKPDRTNCPVCQAQARFHSLLPAIAPALPPATQIRDVILVLEQAPLFTGHRPLALHPRAPPFTRQPV